MNVGDKVKARKEIDSMWAPFVPAGATGYVTDVGFGRLHVSFVVPGTMGGTRRASVIVTTEQIERV